MFIEELKQLFSPFLEEVNFLFSKNFNKGVPISNEMAIFVVAVCIALFFIFFLGYIALSNAFERNERGSRPAALLAIVGSINLPIVKFSVDWWNTLHQPSSISLSSAPSIHYTMLIPLIIMLFALIIYSLIIFLIRYKTEVMKFKLNKKKDYK